MNRALFLDRDGVINIEKHYVYRIEDFEFVEGIFNLCTLAKKLGFLLLVITNQAGIGRGYYRLTDYEKLTNWMLEQFATHRADIERVYYCPFHPTAGIGEYKKESFDRKPNPGMILKAKNDFCLDLTRSVLIGDKDSDIEAGRAAGVKYNLKLMQSKMCTPRNLEFFSLFTISEWLWEVFGPESTNRTELIGEENSDKL